MGTKIKGTVRGQVKSYTLYHGRASVTVEPVNLFVDLPADLAVSTLDKTVVDLDGLSKLISAGLSQFEDAEIERTRKQVDKRK